MNRSWVHLLVVGGLDMTWAIVLFNKTNITISSLCWIARYGYVDELKLWPWQLRLLLWLEGRLGKDHCVAARSADLLRSQIVIHMLDGKP